MLFHGIKVLFIASSSPGYPILVDSLQLQTYKNWELIINYKSDDKRIKTEKDPLNFFFNQTNQGEYVVITNSQNYYVPGFITNMLLGFRRNVTVVYCDIIHNNRLIKTTLKNVNQGAIMFKKNILFKNGLDVQKLISIYGISKFKHIPLPLFFRN